MRRDHEQEIWRTIRFGVEIEFVGGALEEIELLPGWILSLDERQIDDTGEESGSELKPPPIVWDDREQIRVMLARLRAAGARANWNCGLHVHVSLERWGEEAIPRFIEAAMQSQEALQGLLETGEDRRIFCPPVTPEIRERYLAAPGAASLLHRGRPQSHRCGINLAAWYDIGTAEIRYANGSLDEDEVLRVAELCLRFVAAVGEGSSLPREPLELAAELGAPLGGYPKPIAAPRWYRERMWLENALVPILTPEARRLVPGGEILHLLPDPNGILAVIEDEDGRPSKHLFRLPAAGWELARSLPN